LKVEYRGSFSVPAPPEKVYEALRDPANLARAFPGFQSAEPLGEGRARVRLRLSLGPVRGDARVDVRLVEAGDGRLVYEGRGQGAGSTADFRLEIQVHGVDGGSRIEWRFTGDVGGIAASLGGRVLDSMARRLVEQVAARLREQLGEGGG